MNKYESLRSEIQAGEKFASHTFIKVLKMEQKVQGKMKRTLIFKEKKGTVKVQKDRRETRALETERSV